MYSVLEKFQISLPGEFKATFFSKSKSGIFVPPPPFHFGDKAEATNENYKDRDHG